jgi:phosphate starvation-inducible protein PhoH
MLPRYCQEIINYPRLYSPSIDSKLTFVNASGKIVSQKQAMEIWNKEGNKSTDPNRMVPPFKLRFSTKEKDSITVESYVPPSRGPYPYNKPKQNQIPFTPAQTKAIHSGMNPGLTLVVGPPGTGKTDVAVQIISNWYHNFPEQRILLVTHSNQALNQLFDKLVNLDIGMLTFITLFL